MHFECGQPSTFFFLCVSLNLFGSLRMCWSTVTHRLQYHHHLEQWALQQLSMCRLTCACGALSVSNLPFVGFFLPDNIPARHDHNEVLAASWGGSGGQHEVLGEVERGRIIAGDEISQVVTWPRKLNANVRTGKVNWARNSWWKKRAKQFTSLLRPWGYR